MTPNQAIRRKYRRYQSILPNHCLTTCAYCNALATCRDHYLPWEGTYSPFYLPSCTECNSFLGDKIHYTYDQRLEYLLERYDKKYQKLMDVDYQRILPETKGNLRSKLKRDYEIKKRILTKQTNIIELSHVMKDIELVDLHLNKEAVELLANILEELKPV